MPRSRFEFRFARLSSIHEAAQRSLRTLVRKTLILRKLRLRPSLRFRALSACPRTWPPTESVLPAPSRTRPLRLRLATQAAVRRPRRRYTRRFLRVRDLAPVAAGVCAQHLPKSCCSGRQRDGRPAVSHADDDAPLPRRQRCLHQRHAAMWSTISRSPIRCYCTRRWIDAQVQDHAARQAAGVGR